MRRLLEILQECFHILKCVSIFIPVFEIAVGLLVDKKFQMSADPNCPDYSAQLDLDETEIKDKFKIFLDGYQRMFVRCFEQTILCKWIVN